MIKSINAWAFDAARSTGEVFEMAKENGFEGVELTLDENDGRVHTQMSPDDYRRIADEANKAGIKIVSLACGLGWTYPMTAPDDATAKKGIEITATALRIAKALGTDAILVVPGGVGASFIPGFKENTYDAAYEKALAGLEALKPVAEETGVSIGVENVWNKFLLSPLEFRDFIDKLNSPRIGAYFDVGNVLLTGYSEQWIRILGKRIKRVHFKDFKTSVGTLEGFCDLLEGDVNYPAAMQELRNAGYDGPVTAEFFNAEGDLRKISDAMDKILAM